MKKQVMLDLETMGTGNNAAIIAIGAVEFDYVNGVGKQFYEVVDLSSSVKAGGVIDASTVLWWMKQEDAARVEFQRKGSPIQLALQNFRNWLGLIAHPNEICIWGNGATFDNVILRNAYTRLGEEAPWHYGGDRCYRTMKAEHPSVLVAPVGTAHNAVNDAEYQARVLIEIFNNERK